MRAFRRNELRSIVRKIMTLMGASNPARINLMGVGDPAAWPPEPPPSENSYDPADLKGDDPSDVVDQGSRFSELPEEPQACVNPFALWIDASFTLQTLRALEGGLWGDRGENQKALAAFLQPHKKALQAFEAIPAPVLYLLFTPEITEVPREGHVPPHRKAEQRIKDYLTVAAFLSARGDRLLAMRPGRRKGINYRQQICAEQTYDFLVRHGKKPAGSKLTSLYGKAASLFFEGMTGTPGKDLAEECKATLRSRRH
jgi:hypothetical protein